MFSEEIKSITPKNIGWLEAKLSNEVMKKLWFCVNKYKDIEHTASMPHASITNSYRLYDDDNWLYQNILLPLCNKYQDDFYNLGVGYGVTKNHLYTISSLWVNIQKENDFLPLHIHPGAIYGFVIWMKIPFDYKEQHNMLKTKYNQYNSVLSNFSFVYSNNLGEIEQHDYFLNKDSEGTILFFPAKLSHLVYPFRNCNEERISISGNIALNTSTFIE